MMLVKLNHVAAGFLAFVQGISSVLGSPTPPLLAIQSYGGKVNPNSYIVKLKDGASRSAHLKGLQPQLGGTSQVTYGNWSTKFFNGYAGTFDTNTLNDLRASPDVEYIEQDGIMSINAYQNNAPWGLSRLSQADKLSNQNALALNFGFHYDSSDGAGVDLYMIDTGIYTAHAQFGGRARWGATFGGYKSIDGNGHGTHTAATAAGSQFGVAKSANLIAVKVISDAGSGAISDIISGTDYVKSSVAKSGRPSVVNMSFSGSNSSALLEAVSSLTKAGIHVTVAAGNGATNAISTSPANAPSAVTVGATDITDKLAYYSNYGPIVDLYGPGTNITSAWIGSTTATYVLSGTSSPCAHIAGAIAYLTSVEKTNMTPANMTSMLQSYSVKGALSGIPSGSTNDLAQIPWS